jgi:hypothetical protein
MKNKNPFGVLATVLIVTPLIVTTLQGTTDPEAALRAELRQTQAALALLTKEKSDLGKLKADETRASTKLSVDDQQAPAATQQRNAANDVNAAEAQRAVSNAEANERAALAAIAAKAQADALMGVSDRNNFATYATLITSVFGFLSLLAGFFWKAYSDSRDHRWLVESANHAAQATAVHRALELEKLERVSSSAQAAYSEANSVNKKIASIGLKMADSLPLNSHDV